MRRLRGEAGAFSVGLVILIVIVAAAAVATAATSAKRPAASSVAVQSGGRRTLPFIGPALGDPIDDPSDEVAACWNREMERHGLFFHGGSKGWRYENPDNLFPEPRPSGDSGADRDDIESWQRGLQGYVDRFVPDVRAACNRGSAPTPTFPPDTEDWAGTYTVTVTRNGNPECFDVQEIPMAEVEPKEIVATGTARSASFTVKYQGVSDTLSGTVAMALDFTATGTRANGDPGQGFSPPQPDRDMPVKLTGRFVRDGGNFVIRDGELNQESREPCSWEFTAERRRS